MCYLTSTLLCSVPFVSKSFNQISLLFDMLCKTVAVDVSISLDYVIELCIANFDRNMILIAMRFT